MKHISRKVREKKVRKVRKVLNKNTICLAVFA